jgi:hypothetical protein
MALRGRGGASRSCGKRQPWTRDNGVIIRSHCTRRAQRGPARMMWRRSASLPLTLRPLEASWHASGAFRGAATAGARRAAGALGDRAAVNGTRKQVLGRRLAPGGWLTAAAGRTRQAEQKLLRLPRARLLAVVILRPQGLARGPKAYQCGVQAEAAWHLQKYALAVHSSSTGSLARGSDCLERPSWCWCPACIAGQTAASCRPPARRRCCGRSSRWACGRRWADRGRP